jgi:hypothetical protein
VTRFVFAEADRERYGDQVYDIDPYRIDLHPGVTGGLIEEIEDATGYTIMVTLPAGLVRGQYRALRAIMWIAVRVVGQRTDVPFDSFWPDIRGAEFLEPESGPEPAGSDADPPEPDSPTAPTGTGLSTVKLPESS